MRRGFNEHHTTQVRITENKCGEMQLMEEVSEHVGINYPENPDSRYVAQTIDDSVFHWEEAGSAENANELDEDEDFLETMKLPAPQQHYNLDQLCVL